MKNGRKWESAALTAMLAAALGLSLSACGAREPRIRPGDTAQNQMEGTARYQTEETAQHQAGETQTFPEGTGRAPEDADQGTGPPGGTASYKTGRKGDDYILPDALTHVYTQEELAGLTDDELRLARNEIYARHGRRFKSAGLSQYFSERPWYRGTVEPDRFDDAVLGQNERDNLKVIQGLETGGLSCAIPRIGTEEFPKIDGSTATLPLSQAMYRMAAGVSQREAEEAIGHSKTTQAWLSLIRGNGTLGPDLVIAYEPGERVQTELEENGNNILMKPIGRDALVFLANRSNPVHSLTSGQLVDIYSGRLVNWKEAGGPDRRIQAFQRPEDSGSQNLMDKLVMRGKRMADAPKEQVISEMEGLMEKVSAFDAEGDALGYSVYYYARNMYRKPELAFMAVDGVLPSADTIRDGSYPLVNDFYAAIRKDTPKDSRAYELYEWLTSEDGQSLINGLGYVGVGNGAKRLPKELLEPEERFDASIPLPEGHVILGDGNLLYGEQGVGVFDSRMNLLTFIGHVDYDGPGVFSECRSDAVLPMMDTRTAQYGQYSVKENRWVDKDGYGEQVSAYDLAQTFAADHPNLLKKYGVTEQEVDVRYYWESADPVIVIRDGRTEHYYDAGGTWLLDYDTEGKSEEELPIRFVSPVDGHVAYMMIRGDSSASPPSEERWMIYKDGRLVKELSGRDGQISCIAPHFYVRSNESYLYFYNYQDEPCAKFLRGYYNDD